MAPIKTKVSDDDKIIKMKTDIKKAIKGNTVRNAKIAINQVLNGLDSYSVLR